MAKKAASPAAAGPAGAHLEASVAASYLLSMLAGAPPRGLPSTEITEVRVQQAPEGCPLDDVVVEAKDAAGNPATLEIQVKRTVSFSPNDKVFEEVSDQIHEALSKPNFWNEKHILAIAVGRTSRKIDGPYQDVLTWARELGSSKAFYDRLAMPKVGNDDMRDFVDTLAKHLRKHTADISDEIIWQAFCRILILPYDFGAQESAVVDLSKERAATCLVEGSQSKSTMLWEALVFKAIDMAKSGGGISREELVKAMKEKGFSLRGQPINADAREVIAEAAHQATMDIKDQIGGARLTRSYWIAKIQAALDTSRFVEIQGDAGVGKSALLKHFARQQMEQGPAIVLTPERTLPNGWLSMRAAIGFVGTAKDLLSELCLGGEALLFIDNLDRFNPETQKTVIDLMREAANLPDIKIIATSRSKRGYDEQRWLSGDDLKPFKPAAPINVETLADDEVSELIKASPRLGQILAPEHPAKAISRNLYHLSRLVSSGATEQTPASEIDMMRNWWAAGDGGDSASRRDRRRLLKKMASEAVRSNGLFDASDSPPQAVDELVARHAITEFSSDQVGFSHDVLREWAIASVFLESPDLIDSLDLDLPASAIHGRSIELLAAAKMLNDPTGQQWSELLARFSEAGTHPSWPRAVRLCLVRSELHENFLKQAKELLVADDAAMLRNLIRIVKSVDVIPGKDFFLELGAQDLPSLDNIRIPSGPTWHRLIDWLNANMASIPYKALPDVADLFIDWNTALMGMDWRSKLTTKWFHFWLMQIHKARTAETFADRWQPFDGVLTTRELRSFEDQIRSGLLAFAASAPTEAVEYIEYLLSSRSDDQVSSQILKSGTALAKIAPTQLAEVTWNYLVEPSENDEQSQRYTSSKRDAFRHVDNQFMPESPGHGPFYALLEHSPVDGLDLIDRLLSHAIERTEDDKTSDGFLLDFGDRPREVIREDSYLWASEGTNAGYALSCALMALEAWGHARIEADQPCLDVIQDVLGRNDKVPAVLVMIAIHLVLSNNEKCRDFLPPLLGNPNLLVLDHTRTVRDRDFGGYGNRAEPVLGPKRSDLKSKISREMTLTDVLQQALLRLPNSLDSIRTNLERSVSSLPEIRPDDDLGSPNFMAQYALNLIDPSNWSEVELPGENGEIVKGCQYQQPDDEAAHFSTLHQKHGQHFNETNLRAEISLAIDDPARSSSDLAKRAMLWAQKRYDVELATLDWFSKYAIIEAAVLSVRDGQSVLSKLDKVWAKTLFCAALFDSEFSDGSLSDQYRPKALAGLLFSTGTDLTESDTDLILRAVCSPEVRKKDELKHALEHICTIDSRLFKSFIRCKFLDCRFIRRDWHQTDEENEQRQNLLDGEVKNAVAAEIAWLFHGGPEPSFPEIGKRKVYTKRGIRIGGGVDVSIDSDDIAGEPLNDWEFDADSAAKWITALYSIAQDDLRQWFFDLANHYADWTFEANGIELDKRRDVENTPDVWSDVAVMLVAESFDPSKGSTCISDFFSRLCQLPENRFFALVETVLYQLDIRLFDGECGKPEDYVFVRQTIFERMSETSAFKNMLRRKEPSIEYNFGPAFCRVLFSSQSFRTPPTCYLTPDMQMGADAFLPFLEDVAVAAPSYSGAMAILSFVEVSPRTTQSLLLLQAGEAWREAFPTEVSFWIVHGIADRYTEQLEARCESFRWDGASYNLYTRACEITGFLVDIGSSKARDFEQILEGFRPSR